MVTFAEKFKVYIFRVHANCYAGSFERLMAAYITGFGDGTHGTELANWVEVNEEEVFETFLPHVELHRDDLGYQRFASIVKSPYYITDGLGNSYLQDDFDSNVILQNYKESVVRRNEKREEKGQEPRDYPDVPKLSPAYFSVGVFFSKRPPDDVLKLAKQRAQKFVEKQNASEFDDIEPMAKYAPKDLQIHGFDLIAIEPKQTIVWEDE